MFINGDAAGLMKEFNKADRRVARWSASWTKQGAQMALGFVGVQNALTAVSTEVRHVIANVENIPGVPAETVSSIVTMRDNLASAKGWIDRMTAGIVGFGVQAAQAVGVTAAAMAGYSDTSGLSRLETPDEVARSKDPGFDAKIDAARAKLTETSKAAALAIKDEAQQIVTLRQEAERYETFSRSNAINSVERINAKTEAQERLAKANEKMRALNQELAASEEQVRKSMTSVYTATVSRTDAIAGLEGRSQKLFYDIANTSSDGNDPEAVQRRIKLNNELADTQSRLGALYKENERIGRATGEMIASSFEEAIVSGKSFGDVLKGLAMDLAALAIRKAFVNSIGSMFGAGGGSGGAMASFFGGFFADGGRPPAGKVSVVGEHGPELFVPDAAGRVVPNHELGGGGSIVVNQSYNIGAGVTAQQLMPILAMQKREIIGTIADAKRRRTGLGAALR